MGLEASVADIGDLNSDWPLGSDARYQGDNHVRYLKVAVKSLLTNVNQIRVGPAGSLAGLAGRALVVNAAEDGFDELLAVLAAGNNLSDLASAATARSNLGLGGLSTKDSVHETPSGTINGSNVTFTLSETPASDASVQVFRQGVMLRQGTQYTIFGATLTFTSAPLTGDWLWAFYEK